MGISGSFHLHGAGNMNIPIPSEIILGFAGFLVSQDIFSFWPTVIIGTAAGITGSVVSYYMGARGGRDMILKHTAKGGLGARKMIAAKDWFENYGAIAVFTGRLLPGYAPLFPFLPVSPSSLCLNSSSLPYWAPCPGPYFLFM